jgi:hypothetical protein
MSTNKKPQNFSALLGDIRASSINDKLKGRNYKMYMKKVTNPPEKSDLVSMKTLHGPNYSTEKLFTEHSKSSTIDKKLYDRRKIACGGQSQLGVANLNTMSNLGSNLNNLINETSSSEVPPNKIDIKISVNYGKASTPSNQSKSFLQNSHISYNNRREDSSLLKADQNVSLNTGSNYPSSLNSGISTPMNKVPPGLKEKLIKSLKTNVDENLFKKKLIEPKREYNELIHSTQSATNIHKRNQSVNSTFYQNNLNISLMNYDSHGKLNYNNQFNGQNYSNNFPKNSLNTSNLNSSSNKLVNNTYHTAVASPQNESFLYNNNFKNIPLTDTENKIETLENISISDNYPTSNMNEFTLNRNDNDFFKVVSTVTNDNKILISKLEKKLEESLSNYELKLKSQTNNASQIISSTQNKNEITDIPNKTELIFQKFTIFQNIFEEYLKIECDNILVKKIHDGYNEIFKNLISNYNSKINEKTKENENLNLSKKYF